MAIGYLNVAIIGRSEGRSAVAAAAYASRTDLVDERTGTAYRYARKSGDLVTSFVWLPKDAPERLRDRAALWNEVEKAETRKNSQTARRIILALPHELTDKQRQQLLQDFVRENFTRKGLAVDASIHLPDPNGDDRNEHAHLLIPTRFMDANGLGKKDRVSNDQATGLETWRASWVKLANRQLERYGHGARISFEVAEGQTPQNHMGPQATALERQGIETRAGNERLEIITDNMRPPANDNRPKIEATPHFNVAAMATTRAYLSPAQTSTSPELRPANDNSIERAEETESSQGGGAAPEIIDRDEQTAAWQDAVDQAGIDAAEARRQALLSTQIAERQEFERNGREMVARHSIAWNEVVERYHDTGAAYQDGTANEASEAATGALSFFLSWFTSIADSVTRSVTGSSAGAGSRAGTGKAQKHEQKKTQAERRQQQQALEALMAEQSEERAAFERKREEMMRRQELQRGQFEEPEAKRSSALQTSFDQETRFREAMKAEATRKEAKAQSQSQEKGPSRDGPELG